MERFVGGLANQYLAHLRITDDRLEELDQLLADEGWRFRDVFVGYHDGAIYAAVYLFGSYGTSHFFVTYRKQATFIEE